MKKSQGTSSGIVHRDIDRVIVSRGRIASRVEQLAREITDCYGPVELTILAVLTGSLIFLADLIRHLPMMIRLDVVSVSSYPGVVVESQGLQLKLPISTNLSGRDVLVLDDILDSGATLRAILQAVSAAGAASLRSCVLLKKNRPDLPERPEPDFVGLEVPNKFLVGYGLDYNNLYRNLPDICVLRPRAYRKGGAPA